MRDFIFNKIFCSIDRKTSFQQRTHPGSCPMCRSVRLIFWLMFAGFVFEVLRFIEQKIGNYFEKGRLRAPNSLFCGVSKVVFYSILSGGLAPPADICSALPNGQAGISVLVVHWGVGQGCQFACATYAQFGVRDILEYGFPVSSCALMNLSALSFSLGDVSCSLRPSLFDKRSFGSFVLIDSASCSWMLWLAHANHCTLEREGKRIAFACLACAGWRSSFVLTWLILPVVICLSQRLSHACLSISFYTAKLRMAH